MKAQSISCLSNLKQLQLAWSMYVDENNGLLAPNMAAMVGSHSTATPGSWVEGNAQTDMNGTNIQRGVMYAYVKAVRVYRCPGDTSIAQAVRGPRMRSYSMNIWLNGARTPANPMFPPDWGSAVDQLHLVKSKLSELVLPPPSSVFVFMEQHEQSIEDGYMRVENPKYGPWNSWWDLPSDRHNRVGNVSFADHHVEQVKWKYPKKFITYAQSVASASEDQQDFRRAQGWVPVK